MGENGAGTALAERPQAEALARPIRGRDTSVISAFRSPEGFDSAQRMAKLLSSSSLVPQSFQGSIPDCVIALEMAQRLGANPLMVMQNLYVVNGRPAWSSQFLIACVNESGKFTPLRYKLTGDEGTDKRECVAWARDKSGEVLEGPPVSIGIAKAEGWYGRKGSKWQTMPELMLRYRAATFFARTYAPELTMGMYTREEAIEIEGTVTPVEDDPLAAGRHDMKSDKSAANEAKTEQERQQPAEPRGIVEAPEDSTFDRAEAEKEVDEYLSDREDFEAFDRACAAVGITKSNQWSNAGDGQLEALLKRVRED